jgi:hypothetical protein
VAARIKVLLLTEAGIGRPEKASAGEAGESEVTLWPALWRDPDVRWLTGVHPAEGHDYLVRESYEELLWWLLMPSLLRLAAEKSPSRAAVEAMSQSVAEALAAAEADSYRVDRLLEPDAPAAAEAEPDSKDAVPDAKAKSDAQSALATAAKPVVEAGTSVEAEPVVEAGAVSDTPNLPIAPETDAPAVEPALDRTRKDL